MKKVKKKNQPEIILIPTRKPKIKIITEFEVEVK